MRKTQLLIALAAIGFAGSASATNGYFAHGIGIKAKGMGGASIAFAEDGFGLASNPATLSQVQPGVTLGASVFSPDRAVHMSTSYPLGASTKDGNDTSVFLIPELAYVRHGDNGLSYGVAVYGNGGMNVDYAGPVYDNTNKTYTNMEQLFIAPTIAKKIGENNTIAASLNLVYQTFEAGGLAWFAGYTRTGAANPGDHGKDSSTGVGMKLGWTGTISSTVNAGAYYQPETKMSKFDKYRDLFAEDGGFNIPATYGVGLSIKASPATMIAFDIVRIQYGDIKSLANKNNHDWTNTKLGAADGKGFGWNNMTVYKIGVQHQVDNKTTVRAGWNYGKQPIAADQLDFNLLAPAVVQNHMTLGMTRKLDGGGELSLHYMHAFNNAVSGTPAAGTGTLYVDKLEMAQDEFGVQYAWKF